MKKKFLIAVSLGFLTAAAMLTLTACPPPDGEDFQKYNPGDYVEVKSLIFDDRTDFKQTNNDEQLDSTIYDFQCGGTNVPPPIGTISPLHDHTKTWAPNPLSIGQSFMWANHTNMSQRIKFERIFTPAMVTRTFYIGLWVYTEERIQVRLGAFSLSGRIQETRYPITPIAASQPVWIEGGGWSEVVWAGYRHEDAQVTQLGFEQVGGPLQERLFIDDIVILASPVN